MTDDDYYKYYTTELNFVRCYKYVMYYENKEEKIQAESDPQDDYKTEFEPVMQVGDFYAEQLTKPSDK